MQQSRRAVGVIVLLAGLLLSVPACKTLRQLANLRAVDFRIERVTGAELGGIDLSRIRSYEDLDAGDAFRVAQMVARGHAPLEFTLHLGAENPAENDVTARLVEMDWTLLLDDTETISGTFDRNIVLPPGAERDIPIDLRLDLVAFFERSAGDLVELALAATGQGGEPQRIKLRARPTIDTPVGPIRYPEPITITVAEVGD